MYTIARNATTEVASLQHCFSGISVIRPIECVCVIFETSLAVFVVPWRRQRKINMKKTMDSKGFLALLLGAIVLIRVSTGGTSVGGGERVERRHARRSPSQDCSAVATYFKDIQLGHDVPSYKFSGK